MCILSGSKSLWNRNCAFECSGSFFFDGIYKSDFYKLVDSGEICF